MYLKLTISKGSGYISTFDDNDTSLACKPVSSDEISDMATKYSNDDKYIVGMVNEEDGSVNFIVEEKSNPKKLIEAQNMAVQQAAKKIDDSKQSLEFSRYKQDCRKRALDLAHNEFLEEKTLFNKSCKVEDGERNKDGSFPMKFDIIELADKYYNWLISIP